MWSKLVPLTFGFAVAAAAQSAAIDPRSTMQVSFPDDAPLRVVHADWGESKATVRGGAMLLDLRTTLILKNEARRGIRGVTLLVRAQETTPGGKASVSVPSLSVNPGDTFPVRIDLSLLRPMPLGTGHTVEVELDGVLFADLSFYGPDKLSSRRSMTVWELEAQRDRRHFAAVLRNGGPDALQKEFVASLARQSERARWDAQVARGTRATAMQAEHEVQIAFLDVPNAPVEPIEGLARISNNQVRAPQLLMRNRSERTIRFVEMGWLVRDMQGQEFVGGAIPTDVQLAPGRQSFMKPQSSLAFREKDGRPIDIIGLTGYVDHVEFADGTVWVPERRDLQSDPRLMRAVGLSPEEQRLAELYRKKGLPAVTQELRRLSEH